MNRAADPPGSRSTSEVDQTSLVTGDSRFVSLKQINTVQGLVEDFSSWSLCNLFSYMLGEPVATVTPMLWESAARWFHSLS